MSTMKKPGIKSKKTLPEIKLSHKSDETTPNSTGAFPIVGIGASAGGLAAFEAFFSGMPTGKDPGMAFVLVQHLAPDHKSLLTEIIQRYTRMQVFEVVDGVTIQPNCTYIIPPNHDMALLNGTLQLLEPSSSRGQRLPIDFFFRSLAQDQHECAIGIVLSGTGSDGTFGVRAIKAEGGLAIAQSPASCDFDGMPNSAIATGLVDYVLPPAEMAAHLSAYVTHMFGKTACKASQTIATNEDMFRKISVLLRARTGHDFSLYKHNTIARRIERRMAVHQVKELRDYVHFLQQTPAEIDALFYDLLIGVTSFFRNPEIFATLSETAIPLLFDDKPAGATIRVWTCGCSTGEEAYSIAILLQEQMAALKQHFKVQLFATDIDDRAIDQARSGLYPVNIANDISPERLARFFISEPDAGGYRICKDIRDMLIFSKHDLIKDPPFSRIDLISCRNLLIYMGGDLQKRLIPLFHYSLNPGGLLFLGNSESIGDFTGLFATLDRQAKLYQRLDNVCGVRRPDLGELQISTPERVASQQTAWKTLDDKRMPRKLTEQVLLEKHTPVSVLVNEHGDILYIHGRTGCYLELPPGDAGTNNILKAAREGLRHELTVALHSAIVHKETVCRPGLLVKTNGDFTAVNLTVEPVPTDPVPPQVPFTSHRMEVPTLYLVVLEDAPPAKQDQPQAQDTLDAANSANKLIGTDDSRLAALTQELQAKEGYLQSTIEELETSNEELRASNEEMQSVNEELQSTNEELETSKEELQSVNEELATVNAELHTKVAELSRLNNDMNNLLAGTGVGTVFVDHQLCIQRFTPAATKVINLIRSDVGRPVGHIVSNLVNYSSLVEDVQQVLDTLVSKDIEVQDKSGAWFLQCIRPYRTLENVIEGVVIIFTEITETIKAREALQRLAVLVRDSYDAVTVHDLTGRILAWNPAAEKIFGWSEAEALTMNNLDRIPEPMREQTLDELQQLCRAEVLQPFLTKRLTKDGRTLDVWLTASALVNESGQVYAIATTERERPL